MDEKTQLLELPGWFQELREEHRAREAEALEPTVVVSRTLEAKTLRVEAVGGGREAKTLRVEAVGGGREAKPRHEKGGAEGEEETAVMPAFDAKTRPAIDVPAPVMRERVVRVWSRMKLASVTQGDAEALRGLVRITGGERLRQEVLQGLEGVFGKGWQVRGSSRVGVHWEEEAGAFAGGVSTWWRVMPGWERGLVWVNPELGRAWLRALGLGDLGGDEAHGAVCCAIGEVMGGALERCGWPQVSWGVNPLPGRAKVELMRASRPPYVEWVLEVGWTRGRGLIRVVLPWTLVRRVEGQLPRSREVPEGAAVWPVWGRLTAGSVRLSLGEVRGLGVGDVVLCGEVNGEGVGAELRAGATVGFGGRLQVGTSGCWQLVINEALAASGEEGGAIRAEAIESEEEEQMTQATAVEGAEVEVVVEVGRVKLTVGELSRLVPGQVVETEAAVGGPVRLLVGDQEVARGELVEVEGRLGVRVERVCT
ncbi:YscQ/HrcQ family type III secretion apparatus protein [Lujinxingia litoralis]|uniref:YscQ/HrcQ family type III secretion apparatus protein n=1 Tax=Lujinxingia litoralis TaxID=2211119 RepID=A0A328CBR4_9DELT|nr:type III secretion system cytoplasmic ring protein SctQ [Lujinxingia litoralis]RAL23939.1 YscQ/HrcQ family type III secretion apparatus protein [Lujinxingia litoralis]